MLHKSPYYCHRGPFCLVTRTLTQRASQMSEPWQTASQSFALQVALFLLQVPLLPCHLHPQFGISSRIPHTEGELHV